MLRTSLPLRWRDALVASADAASSSGKVWISGTRTAPVSTSSRMRSRYGRSRPTLGRSAVTSPRGGSGAAEPETLVLEEAGQAAFMTVYIRNQ